MLKTGLKTMLLTAVAMTAFAGAASAGKLTIESWRNDDATIWKEKIIPAFQAKHPGHHGGIHADRAQGIQCGLECPP